MDRLFEDSFVSPSRILGAFGSGVTTPVDMYHTANDVVVKAEKVKPKQIKVKAKGVIEGKK